MNLTVVLAEDDPDIQLVARLSLKRAGFIVRVVGNGQEALDAIRLQAPDVVLLDWMMPELDGPETCRQLKADPATAGIPVIFLTAKSQEARVNAMTADHKCAGEIKKLPSTVSPIRIRPVVLSART